MTLKTQNQVKLRCSQASDVLELMNGKPFQYSFRGVTLLDGDDKILCMSGVMYSRPMQCFLNIAEDINPKKHRKMAVIIIREVRKLLENIQAPVYAVPDPKYGSADSLLRYTGFEKINDGVYQWMGKH